MPATDLAALAGECRAEMARQGLTLGALSDLTQPRLSVAALSRILSGERDIPVAKLVNICDALGVGFYELCRRAEAMRAAS